MSVAVWLLGGLLFLSLAGLASVLFFARRRQIAWRARASLALGLSARLLSAPDEESLLRAVLASGCDLLGARGGSFVPFDEVRHLLPAVAHGAVPEGLEDVWLTRLALPAVRQTCKLCEQREAGAECALLRGARNAERVVCAAIRFGGREQGVLNFYFAEPRRLTEDEHALISGLAMAVDGALSSLRARDEELAALRFLRSARERREDLPGVLQDLLERLHEALDFDLALVWVPGAGNGRPALWLEDSWPRGNPPARTEPAALDELWQEARRQPQPFTRVNTTLSGTAWAMLLVFPLAWGDEAPGGLLVLGCREMRHYNSRQLILLRALSGQIGIIIRDRRQLARVEYEAVAVERSRLAREIHDGLAQTLAFLKMETARMQSYLETGQSEPLARALRGLNRTLADAYLDARQAIDDLRRAPDLDLRTWLERTAADFHATTGLLASVSVGGDIPELRPGDRAQLARIVQEALNNVRKHSGARAVSLAASRDGGGVLIEVRDDGRGFSPEPSNAEAGYGLRGMRERAESLGADLQVESQPGRGTAVRVRIPVEGREGL